MTASEEYALLKEKRFDTFLNESFANLKGVDLFEVKVPSGMTFKCRKVGTDYLAAAGAMPMALSEQMLSPDKPKEPTQMTAMEIRANIQANAQMVRYICVEPRLIVGEVNGHKDAISVDALSMEDFGHLTKWASGGDAAEGLKTFRRKR
jgi:hypothetical protein